MIEGTTPLEMAIVRGERSMMIVMIMGVVIVFRIGRQAQAEETIIHLVGMTQILDEKKGQQNAQAEETIIHLLGMTQILEEKKGQQNAEEVDHHCQ